MALAPATRWAPSSAAVACASGSSLRRRAIPSFFALAGKLAPPVRDLLRHLLMVPLIIEGLFEVSFKGAPVA